MVPPGGYQLCSVNESKARKKVEKRERQGDDIRWRSLASLVNELTSSRTVGDSKDLPSKLLYLYFLNKLSSFSYEALDSSVLPVSHTHFLSVRKEDQAVGDPEWYMPPPVWWAFSHKNKTRWLNMIRLDKLVSVMCKPTEILHSMMKTEIQV